MLCFLLERWCFAVGWAQEELVLAFAHSQVTSKQGNLGFRGHAIFARLALFEFTTSVWFRVLFCDLRKPGTAAYVLTILFFVT